VAQSRRRIARPYRRLQRWARHTPNGTIGLNLAALGLLFLLVAAILAATVLH
jgi:hypothetical protein